MASLFEELKRRNVIRVALVYVFASWLLVQVADIMFESFGTPDWVMKTFIGFLGLGFPIAVIFAWAFEITPEGLKKEKDVDRSQSVTPQTGRKLDYAIIAVLVLAVGYFAVDKFVLRGGDSAQTADSSTPSIAVLPFADMSAAKDQEYLSDGISEELLNLLAKVPDFKVAGRTSSFVFKNQEQDLRRIGEQLGVGNILEGSVRKSGNRIRITAQLVKADDGFHLWSESYDRELDDIFAVQDEIAAAVVAALKVTLLGEAEEAIVARNDVVSPEVYELYLKARYHWHQRTPESLAKSVDFFQQALDLDPGYAPAYSGLALAHLFETWYSDADPQIAIPKAAKLIDSAFKLDPNLADAWGASGVLRWNMGDNESAAEAYEKAIELDPQYAMAHMWLATTYGQQGEPEKALATFARAREIEPLHPTLLSNYLNTLNVLGRYEDARELALVLRDVYPNQGDGAVALAAVAAEAGDFKEAIVQAVDAWRLEPEVGSLSVLVAAYLSLGEFELARAWNEMPAERTPANPFVIGNRLNRMWLQQRDTELLAAAEEAVNMREYWGWHWMAGISLLRTGDIDAAREAFDRAFMKDEKIEVTTENSNSMAEYAIVLRATGDPERANAILNEALRLQRDLESAGYTGGGGPAGAQARLLVQLGDNAPGLAALRRAVEQGNRDVVFWRQDFALEPLYDDIGFITLADEVEAMLDEQHAALEVAGLLATPDELLARMESETL